MEIDVPPPEVRKKVYMATYESKTHEDIKKAYQSWAPFYELHIVDEGWKAPWLCANLLTKFETEQEAKILDVGAGGCIRKLFGFYHGPFGESHFS